MYIVRTRIHRRRRWPARSEKFPNVLVAGSPVVLETQSAISTQAMKTPSRVAPCGSDVFARFWLPRNSTAPATITTMEIAMRYGELNLVAALGALRRHAVGFGPRSESIGMPLACRERCCFDVQRAAGIQARFRPKRRACPMPPASSTSVRLCGISTDPIRPPRRADANRQQRLWPAGVSTCGGILSKYSRRPSASKRTVVIPD